MSQAGRTHHQPCRGSHTRTSSSCQQEAYNLSASEASPGKRLSQVGPASAGSVAATQATAEPEFMLGSQLHFLLVTFARI